MIASDLDGIRIQAIINEVKSHSKQNIPELIARVVVYQDDVEILNTTSKKAGVHKQTGIYCFLSNYGSPSNVKELDPLIICNALDYKKYGSTKVLDPFLDDIEKYKKGQKVKIHGIEVIVKVVRVGDTGDSLGLADMYDLRGNAADIFCRNCTIDRGSFKKNINYEAPLRSPDEYIKKIEEIKKCQKYKDKDNICQSYGLKTESHIDKIPKLYELGDKIHPFKQTIYDSMHDCLEGGSKLIANNIISYTVKNTQITLSDINTRIKKFHYGPLASKDKPLPITHSRLSEGKDVGSNAIQTWVLLRILPFILADAKEKKDKSEDEPKLEEIFELLSIHLQMLSIIFSKELKKEDVEILHSVILEHNSFVESLFPNISRLNKFHHLTHYADSIILNGPLHYYWTVRLESFHQYIKRISISCRNFINLSKTCAVRLSFMFSYFRSYPEEEQALKCGTFKSMVIENITYKQSMTLCISPGDDDKFPCFGSIRSIEYTDEMNSPEITLVKFNTVGWSDFFHGFEVSNTNAVIKIKQKDLIHKYPLDLWTPSGGEFNGNKFVSIKYLLRTKK